MFAFGTHDLKPWRNANEGVHYRWIEVRNFACDDEFQALSGRSAHGTMFVREGVIDIDDARNPGVSSPVLFRM